MKWYSNRGLYYTGDLNVIAPVIFGVATRDVYGSILLYFGIMVAASVFGYMDFTRLKRIQYEESLNTLANPYLLNEIRSRNAQIHDEVGVDEGMSRKVGNLIILEQEPEGKCELCGKIDELRPYGKNNEKICFECGMKNEEVTKRKFNQKFFSDLNE